MKAAVVAALSPRILKMSKETSVMLFAVLDGGAPVRVDVHGLKIPLVTMIAGSDPIAAIQKLAVNGPADVELIGLVDVADADFAVERINAYLNDIRLAFSYGKILHCYAAHPDNLRALLLVVTD